MNASIWNPGSLAKATTADLVAFAPTATIAATDVQAAIEEADTENRALRHSALAAVRVLSRSDFDNVVSSERWLIATTGVGVYPETQRFHIVGELGARLWTIGEGVNNSAIAAASHARKVEIRTGLIVSVTNDVNVCRSTAGTPTGGLIGDIAVDYDSNLYWQLFSGGWGTGREIFVGGSGGGGGTSAIGSFTARDWMFRNPVLAKDAIGIARDTGEIRVGDGVKQWRNLLPAFGIKDSLTVSSHEDGHYRAPSVAAVVAALARLPVPGFTPMDIGETISASRTLNVSDFDGRLLRVAGAGAVTLTLNTYQAMGLPAPAGQLRSMQIHLLDTPLTLSWGSGVTVNGVVGSSTLALTAAAAKYRVHTLLQARPGQNEWSVF